MKKNILFSLLLSLCLLLCAAANAEESTTIDLLSCQHENVEEWEFIEDDYIVVSKDSNGHTLKGTVEIDLDCKDCSMVVGEPRVMENYELTDEHSYWDGICLYCGYENTCPHTDTYINEGFGYEWTITALDEKTHSTTGDWYSSTRCRDCNDVMGMKITEEYVLIEDHDFVDGVCEYCDYESTCLHENTEVYEWLDDYTVIAQDETSHTLKGTLDIDTFCIDCDEIIDSQKIENHEWIETHTYANGVCEYCGYANACPHTDTYVYEWLDDYTVIAQDEKTHTLKGTWLSDTYCWDCDERIDRKETEGYALTENHRFWDGVCRDCEYVNSCLHENTEVDKTGIDGEFTAYDEETHTFTGFISEIETCLNCDEIISRVELGQGDLVDSHTFDESGACWCGYVKPTATPTENPTEQPTAAPTENPTEQPTAAPTDNPTAAPTEIPEQEEDTDVPKTGDDRSGAYLWGCLMMLAAFTLLLNRRLQYK